MALLPLDVLLVILPLLLLLGSTLIKLPNDIVTRLPHIGLIR